MKTPRWLDCHQHIDLNDTEPYITQATQTTAEFLQQQLGIP